MRGELGDLLRYPTTEKLVAAVGELQSMAKVVEPEIGRAVEETIDAARHLEAALSGFERLVISREAGRGGNWVEALVLELRGRAGIPHTNLAALRGALKHHGTVLERDALALRRELVEAGGSEGLRDKKGIKEFTRHVLQEGHEAEGAGAILRGLHLILSHRVGQLFSRFGRRFQ